MGSLGVVEIFVRFGQGSRHHAATAPHAATVLHAVIAPIKGAINRAPTVNPINPLPMDFWVPLGTKWWGDGHECAVGRGGPHPPLPP